MMMRRIFLAVTIAIVGGLTLATAQTHTTRARTEAKGSASAQAGGQSLGLDAGTRLAAELQNTLDARHARVGDRVVLKTTENLKANGRVVVKKGARLLGRVTEVGENLRGQAGSSISLVFDRLESGSLVAPISATITSVTQTRARAHADDTDLDASASTRSDASTRTRQSSGGLLGGVTGAVGNTVGTTTRAAGDIVSGTTETAGNAAGSVGRAVGSIRITQSAGASLEGGSTLSLTGGNLRLEKGTTFRLALSESANVGDNQ